MKFYTGAGSRDTPADILDLMTQIAEKMAELNFILRTGGAEGADQAFSEGAEAARVFIPWDGYNDLYPGHRDAGGRVQVVSGASSDAFDIAGDAHPAWDRCSQGAKKLHARNVYQVLGRDLETPSNRLICWTPDGAESNTSPETGGTGQAIRIANRHGVPVHNLQRKRRRKEYQSWISK